MSGFVLPLLAIGLGAISVRPQRGFIPPVDSGQATLVPQTTLREQHRDELEITDHPVERGAPITDHAFMRPAEVVIECAWSNSPSGGDGLIGAAVGLAASRFAPVGALAAAFRTASAAQSLLTGSAPDQARAIYAQLLALQASRIPFDIMTGKRVYKDMLFKTLAATTDKDSDNALVITATCRQVILVSTRAVRAPVNADAQRVPTKTSPITNLGQRALLMLPGGALS